MARHLIITMAADHERALADPNWNDLATGLTDAITGLWQAPTT